MSGPTTTPKVWIADLAAYNNMKLHGEWVEADSLETLEEAKDRILRTSPEPFAEEFAIHDYEGFGDYPLGEYPGLALVAALGEAINEHGDPFVAFIGGDCDISSADDVDDAVTRFQDTFKGECSLRDYAEENASVYIGGDLTQEQWERIEPYVDVDQLETELDNEGFYEQEVGGKTFLFGP